MIFGEGELDSRRPCLVDGDQAYFHRWVDSDEMSVRVNAFVNAAEMAQIEDRLRRCAPLPQICDTQILRRTFALVEYINGVVEMVHPERIQFIDG